MSTVVVTPAAAVTAPSPGLEQAIDAWLAELDVAATTRESYRKGIRDYQAFLHAQNLTGSSRVDVLAYKKHLAAQYAPGTVSTRLTAVRSFYTHVAATTGAPNVAAGVSGAKATRGHKKDALNADQVSGLLDAPAGATALRDKALLTLMVATGLRTIEVARAQVADLRTSGGVTVLDVWGKGREGKDALVIVTAPVEKAIRTYLAARGPVADTAPLFASTSNRNPGGHMTTRAISRIVKNHLVASGLSSSRLTAHSLRHTAVTAALLGGASLEEAQHMARHANIATTQVYAHNIDRLKGKAEQAASAYLRQAIN